MNERSRVLRVGIVGTGRGLCLKNGLEASGRMRIVANCDINPKQNQAVREKWGIPDTYEEYETMLEKADLDVVVVATPMQLHVPQAIGALRRGIHVISEVTAGVSVEECRKLVLACRQSKAVYMIAENALYIKENAVIRELVRRGLFGTVYYGEGEYLHCLRAGIEGDSWRRRYCGDVNGITYGTHPLGPILSWMPEDRVVAVCCVGSGHHYRDSRGVEFKAEDTCVMLCRMKSGGLVKIRVDMMSMRPAATINYMLQGTEGCYESCRLNAPGGRVWIRSRSRSPEEWTDIACLEEEFLPEIYRRLKDVMKKDRVHLGNDCITGAVCEEIIAGKRPNELGIDIAMDMTLPGLISQQSILQEGRWLEVPDSRDWQAPA